MMGALLPHRPIFRVFGVVSSEFGTLAGVVFHGVGRWSSGRRLDVQDSRVVARTIGNLFWSVKDK